MELYSLVFFLSIDIKQFITVLFFYNIALICDPKTGHLHCCRWHLSREWAYVWILFLYLIFTLKALNRSWVYSWENQKQNGGNYILNFGLKLLEVLLFTACVGTIYSLCWGNTYYMCSLLSRISLKPLNEVQTVKKAWLCWTLLCARNADFFWPLSPLVVTITKITAFN